MKPTHSTPDYRTLLQEAWQEMRQMRAELESLAPKPAEPVAIIGMDCRFPGGANSPEAYWQLLQNGIDAITEVPPDRWDVDAYYDPDPDMPGKLYCRSGGFLDQVDQFDPQFFGISPREAASLDPQQRLLLEVSYTALERAGQAPDRLQGSQTGVYIGISFEDYAKLSLHSGDPTRIDAYSSLGNTRSIAVGRLSYVLGLQGPTMQLDTTCSSSLLAVHLACQSLRSGESNLALAGGVNVMISPEPTIGFCRLKALSPDGHCKTFDANANGYVRGEGCGIVVLKRLSDAIANRDQILAVIRGSAVNHDGQSNGLTAPNGSAQEAVIRQAIRNAGVAPAQIQYVETHGTGTPLGDPIEVLALGKVLSEGRSTAEPLWIGSVKTNFGHLESAAGVAGLIKTVLALQHQQIPPHLHFQQPNPHIPWNQLPIQVSTQLTPWTGEVRLAGVSSFGMSGTNVHVIVEEYSQQKDTVNSVADDSNAASHMHLFTLSAKSQSALKQLAERYEIFLANQSDISLSHLCFTANTGRSQFEHRFAAMVGSIEQLQQQLRDFVQTGRCETPAHSLVQSYLQGTEIDWNQIDNGNSCQRIVLPTYPFQKQRYWMEPPVLPPRGGHPLLGRRLVLAKSATIHFEAHLDQNHPAFLQQHRVFAKPIMPMAGYIEMVLAAGAEVLQSQLELEIFIHQPLQVDCPMTVQLVLTELAESQEQSYQFEIFAVGDVSNTQKIWNLYASGTIREIDLADSSLDILTLTQDCSEVDIADFYQTYRQHGIEYGPAFQAIRQLWQGDQTIARIELPSSPTFAYQIHPVLLDAGLQTVAAALSARNPTSPTYLPVGIERLAFHGKKQPCWSQLKLRSPGDSSHPIADLQFLDVDGTVIVTIEGLKLQPAVFDSTQRQTDMQNWLYQVEWRPHPFGARQTDLLAPSEIRNRLNPGLIDLEPSEDWSEYERLIAGLESRSLSYIINSFLELGWQFVVGDYFSIQQLIQQLGLTVNQKFLKRLLEMLLEAGFLDLQHETYRVVQPLQPAELNENHFVNHHPELTLLHRCGSSLAKMLQGRCDPIQLLFPDGDLTTLSQIYQDSTVANLTNNLVCQVVQSVLENQSNVRVLEIGGGTGGTTNYLLPCLDPETTQYTFTDISPLFIERAKQKFKKYSFVDYQVLDIERSPHLQKNDFQQYDIIIAANVLHATHSLRATLTHVRQLLAPGGLLILLEGVYPMRWLDLTFGLTDGWWRFADLDLRSSYPLISVEQWQQVLQHDFASIEVIQPRVNQTAIQQAVILAQVSADVPAQSSDSDWLIVADHQGVSAAVIHRLQAQGAAYRVISVADLPQLTITRSTQILFLAALDLPCAADLTLESLEVASREICGNALALIQALATTHPIRLWLVTQGAVATGIAAEKLSGLVQSLLWGMGKTINLEHPEFGCVCVDLDPADSPSRQADLLLAEIQSNHRLLREQQVTFRQQQRYVARLVRCQNQFLPSLKHSLHHSVEAQRLEISQRGLLENLQVQTVERQLPHPDEVEIRVLATGLNFRDVLNALDLYLGEAGPLGCECVGEISRVGEAVTAFKPGDRVMALASGGFSNWVTVKAAMVAPIPETLSYEAAATIPVAFLTAGYALHHLAKLKQGERVLIHAAAGGVGQAAIQIAQQVGAEIYTTASPEKWATVQAMGVTAVCNSRSLDFAADLMQLTNGAGVDVVLNSLAGEFIPQSLAVLKPNGRFVELGKTDWNADRVTANYPTVNYFQMDLAELCHQPELIQLMFQDTLQRIQQNIYQPLPYSVFPIAEAVQAFRTMQQAKHIGKIVITQPLLEQARIQADGTYLITGGLGGLGLLVAEWLVQQGAKCLVLISRHESEAATQQIQSWKQAGIEVVKALIDVAEQSQLVQLLTTLEQSLPPIRGIIHAAGVLEDAMLQQQTWEKFAAVLRPKLLGAWNLHQLTQTQPLDFFVLFSSATALLGSLGQSNHVVANTFLDTLAHYRQSLNLPALSINWGIWSDVGAAAVRQAEARLKGVESISPSQGLQTFEALLFSPFAQVGVMPMRWAEFLQQGIASPFFAELQLTQTVPAETSDLLQQLQAAPEQHRSLLQDYLCHQIARVLGFQATEIDPQKGFFDLGMDSLTSVELKNRLQADLNCTLPATVAFDYPTVNSLVDYLITQLKFDANELEPEEKSQIERYENGENLSQLSQSELADLLAQELMEIK
jgi:acyl transferase domain-containing protein/acyl carrier protein/phospholipid N-methyltransferase